MKMDPKVEKHLNLLREVIHEAIAMSADVAEAMASLEEAGLCPSLSIDVAIPDPELMPILELVTRDGPLILTDSDSNFLRNMGIVTS
jgi:hypothetical protein